MLKNLLKGGFFVFVLYVLSFVIILTLKGRAYRYDFSSMQEVYALEKASVKGAFLYLYHVLFFCI